MVMNQSAEDIEFWLKACPSWTTVCGLSALPSVLFRLRFHGPDRCRDRVQCAPRQGFLEGAFVVPFEGNLFPFHLPSRSAWGNFSLCRLCGLDIGHIRHTELCLELVI